MSIDFAHVEAATDPPLITKDLQGIGGELKREPEDFQVVEIPAYMPSGKGDHLWITVEKRNLAHGELLNRIANTLNISPNSIGYAGAKDKRAITRQAMTVPAEMESRIEALEAHDLKVLDVDRHEHRIRRGHLRANTFSLTVHGTHPEAEALAGKIIETITPVGFPNYFGMQRFGTRAGNISRGLELLELLAAGKKVRKRFENTMALNSVQSWLFNLAVSMRMENETFDAALLGDILKKRATGGLFVAEDVETEISRVRAGEVIATGPIYGRKMWWPTGDSGAFEQKVLAEGGLTMESFGNTRKLMLGTRRPIAVMPHGMQIDKGEGNDSLKLSFTLPKGTYATVLLREIMKTDLPEDHERTS